VWCKWQYLPRCWSLTYSGQLRIPSHISVLHVEQEVVGDDTTALESVLQCDTVRDELLRKEREISANINCGYVFARIKHLNCVHMHVCYCVCVNVFCFVHTYIIHSFSVSPICLSVSCISCCLVCLIVTNRLKDIMHEADCYFTRHYYALLWWFMIENIHDVTSFTFTTRILLNITVLYQLRVWKSVLLLFHDLCLW
jgi:hypothetical protein